MYSEKKSFKTRRKNTKKGDGIVDLFGQLKIENGKLKVES